MDTPTSFAAAAGISKPYACQILSGIRVPSMPMAIKIYRRTGRKFGPISKLSSKMIDALEASQAAA